MSILDFLEAWYTSQSAALKAVGIECQFRPTPDDRLNPACAFNARFGVQEVDWVVWASGEAELTTADAQGEIKQRHFDNVVNLSDLVTLLNETTALIVVAVSTARNGPLPCPPVDGD